MATSSKSNNDLQTTAEAIAEEFPADDAPSVDAVSERLASLVQEYRVPIEEAERATRNYFLSQTGLEFRDLDQGDSDSDFTPSSEAEPTDLVSIDQGDQWLDAIVATVVELWEPQTESIGQVGLLGDASGTIKFVKWATSDLPELEEDDVYRFENVVTDEYEGRYSVNLNSATDIEAVDQDIEVGDNTVAIDGALVAIQSGSGLIKRCTAAEDCNRALQSGRCGEHGDVQGEFDLRIKGVIDDGEAVHQVVFDADATEELTGISLADAKERAKDALDTSVVVSDLEAAALGHYFHVEGPHVGAYLLVNEIAPPEVNPGREQLLERAGSLSVWTGASAPEQGETAGSDAVEEAN